MSCFPPRLQTSTDLHSESLYIAESSSYPDIATAFNRLPPRTLLNLTVHICCRAKDKKLFKTLKKIQKLVLSRCHLNILNLQGNFEQYPQKQISSVSKLIGEACILQCGNRAGTFLVASLPHLSFKAAFISCPGFFILSSQRFSLLANDLDVQRDIQLVRLFQKHWGFTHLSQVMLLPTSHALDEVLETLSVAPIQTIEITDKHLPTFEKLKLPHLTDLSIIYTSTDLLLPSLSNTPKLSTLALKFTTRDHHAKHQMRMQVADWVHNISRLTLYQIHKFGSAEYISVTGRIVNQQEADDLLSHPRSVNRWAKCLTLHSACDDSSETTSENSDVL